MTAIPTLYNGTQYRSLLEAKWAAFFELAGIEACYEPEGFSGYIPDFTLNHGRLVVEVKPLTQAFDLTKIRQSGWGVDMGKNRYASEENYARDMGDILLVTAEGPLHASKFYRSVDNEHTKQGTRVWEWICKAAHFFQVGPKRPDSPDEHYFDIGGNYSWYVCEAQLTSIWKQACNAVQWKGKQNSSCHNPYHHTIHDQIMEVVRRHCLVAVLDHDGGNSYDTYEVLKDAISLNSRIGASEPYLVITNDYGTVGYIPGVCGSEDRPHYWHNYTGWAQKHSFPRSGC